MPAEEVDGKGYLVIVGGGTGNILENWGVRDMKDMAILAVESWTYIGYYQCLGGMKTSLGVAGGWKEMTLQGGTTRPVVAWAISCSSWAVDAGPASTSA